MAKKTSKKTSIYSHLDSTKVLEHGTAAEVEAAKKAYWKAYKAAWRKCQRNQFKQFTIALTEPETKQIRVAAKKHKRSCSRFIKESCFAYINRAYLVIDVLAVRTIEQLLAMNYDALKQAFDAYLLPFDLGKALMAQMAELEERVVRELNHPQEVKTGCDGD